METILYLLAALVVMWSQFKVNGAYNRYRQIQNDRHITGAQVARRILNENGLNDVDVEYANGTLGDHYDPKAKVVRLSKDIYENDTIASVSVAAHECGHAIQHAQNYGFIALRNSLLPLTNFASNLGWPVLLIGFWFSMEPAIYFGIALLVVVLLFQVVTLPVELNTSSRALTILSGEGMITDDERSDVKSMLSAAAFTYIAAVISSALNILRLVLLTNKRRND